MFFGGLGGNVIKLTLGGDVTGPDRVAPVPATSSPSPAAVNEALILLPGLGLGKLAREFEEEILKLQVSVVRMPVCSGEKFVQPPAEAVLRVHEIGHMTVDWQMAILACYLPKLAKLGGRVVGVVRPEDGVPDAGEPSLLEKLDLGPLVGSDLRRSSIHHGGPCSRSLA